MFGKVRKTNMFEWILLPVGFFVGVIGFYFINKMFMVEQGLSWEMITAMFIWLALVFLIIIAATNEDLKEELSQVVTELASEMKLSKVVVTEQLSELKLLREEIKLLRQDITKKKTK